MVGTKAVESPFLVKEICTLLRDDESVVDLTEDMDSQSQSESQSQAVATTRSSSRSHTMLVKATTPSGTLVLVDNQLSIEAFLNADTLNKIKSKRGFKNLSRLKGVRLGINQYFYATPGYCLAKSHMQTQPVRSRSRASTIHQPGPICLWVEEFDAPVLTEVIVGTAGMVEEEPQIKKLLNNFSSAQLESRLIQIQQLDPSFACFLHANEAAPGSSPAKSKTSASTPQRKKSSDHVVMDILDLDECEIPKDQEDQLNQVEGWQKTHEKTDSQLIEENGTMPGTEPEETTTQSESQGATTGGVSPTSTISERSNSSERQKPSKTRLIRRAKPMQKETRGFAFGKENVQENFPVCDDTEDEEEEEEEEDAEVEGLQRNGEMLHERKTTDNIEEQRNKSSDGLSGQEKNDQDNDQEDDAMEPMTQPLEPLTQQFYQSDRMDSAEVDKEPSVSEQEMHDNVNDSSGEGEDGSKKEVTVTTKEEEVMEIEYEDDSMWHTQAIDQESQSQLFRPLDSAATSEVNANTGDVIDLVEETESIRELPSGNQQHKHPENGNVREEEQVEVDSPTRSPAKSSPSSVRQKLAVAEKKRKHSSLPPTPAQGMAHVNSNSRKTPTATPTRLRLAAYQPSDQLNGSQINGNETNRRVDNENARSDNTPSTAHFAFQSTTRTVAQTISKSVSCEWMAKRPSKRFRHLFPPLELHELMERLSKP